MPWPRYVTHAPRRQSLGCKHPGPSISRGECISTATSGLCKVANLSEFFQTRYLFSITRPADSVQVCRHALSPWREFRHHPELGPAGGGLRIAHLRSVELAQRGKSHHNALYKSHRHMDTFQASPAPRYGRYGYSEQGCFFCGVFAPLCRKIPGCW